MLRKINHGEVMLKEITEVPENAKKINCNDNFIIVGESETLGNDHRVAVLEDTMLFEKDGVLYIKNDSESTIFCPNKQRHDTAVLPSSTWEIGIAQEYDYLTQEQRNVAD